MFGVQHNLNPVSLLPSWSICYQGLYSVILTEAAVVSILRSCNKTLLLLACRPVTNINFTVAAMGNRSDVLYDCDTIIECTHLANGVGWYFSDRYSWGFVNGDESVTRKQCDTNPVNNGVNGLCWHTTMNSGGYQCGSNINLNSDSTYERLIYHSN
ncbi:unnamed protein product [Rotaria socialis]|nr:unnamed protein product [Rotaria socialis]CAF3384854.1 unnamed protein product [Rotaria socialis]CAF3395444.1 unnamed protein product [Rotaria socialis]CAF3564841.1 unnamed protein product [Rotaria socialis]CAF3686562.1 unnamed protein product [Rotaria socialis]